MQNKSTKKANETKRFSSMWTNQVGVHNYQLNRFNFQLKRKMRVNFANALQIGSMENFCLLFEWKHSLQSYTYASCVQSSSLLTSSLPQKALSMHMASFVEKCIVDSKEVLMNPVGSERALCVSHVDGCRLATLRCKEYTSSLMMRIWIKFTNNN